jgi:RNA polymerase sigma-70 factor, ECF subfamily
MKAIPTAEGVLSELVEAIPHLQRWAQRFETIDYDADSLVGDTVVGFLERPEIYVPERGSLRNLLFSALNNRAKDHRRKCARKYRSRFRDYLRHERSLFSKPDELESREEELRGRIELALTKMPKTQATVFRLFALDGKNYIEICEILGVGMSCVKTAICRARARIRKTLRVS